MTNEQAVQPDTDGSYRIKADRVAQLRKSAVMIEEMVTGDNPDTSNRILERRAAQLRIIADEIEHRPEASVLAQRIYEYIKDWVTFAFAGKNLTNSGPFLTPVYVHNKILEILEDPYAHLDTLQREAIRFETAHIMAAGDGTNQQTYEQARGVILDWTIEQMIIFCGECGWENRIKFDPRTGGDWDTDGAKTEA